MKAESPSGSAGLRVSGCSHSKRGGNAIRERVKVSGGLLSHLAMHWPVGRGRPISGSDRKRQQLWCRYLV